LLAQKNTFDGYAFDKASLEAVLRLALKIYISFQTELLTLLGKNGFSAGKDRRLRDKDISPPWKNEKPPR
jgi:hypothetical protein